VVRDKQNSIITEVISINLSSLIKNNDRWFFEEIRKRIMGNSGSLEEIGYQIVGHEGNDVLLKVSAKKQLGGDLNGINRRI